MRRFLPLLLLLISAHVIACVDYVPAPWLAGVVVGQGHAFTDVEYADGMIYALEQNPDQIESPQLHIWQADDFSVVGGRDLTYRADQMLVDGGFAYLVGPSWLSIIDLEDAAYAVAGAASIIGLHPVDLAMAGDILCVAVYGRGLTLASVEFPGSPYFLASDQTLDLSLSVSAYETMVYLGTEGQGLAAIYIGDPSDPQVVSVSADPYTIYAQQIVGDYLYASADLGLLVFDIAMSGNPVLCGQLDAGQAPWQAGSLVVDGGIAYMGIGSGDGVYRIDVSDPTAPVPLGFVQVGAQPLDICASADHLWLATETDGVHRVEIASAVGYSTLNRLAMTHDLTGLTSGDGDRAYAAAGADGVLVLDLSDPIAPLVTTVLPTATVVTDVFHSGGFLLTCGAQPELFNVMAEPVLVGSLDITNINAYAQGSGAVYAVGADGLYILLMSCTGVPSAMPIFDGYGEIVDIAVDGAQAALLTADGSLVSLDLSIPPAPELIGVFPAGDHPQGVALSGTTAYVPNLNDGLFVIDISDSLAPPAIYTLPTADIAVDVKIRDDIAYLATVFSGLQIVDISQPPLPVSLNFVGPAIMASSLMIQGDYLYAAGDSSLSVAPLHCGTQLTTEPVFPEPETPSLIFCMSLYPNPFNPFLDVRYEVKEPSLVRISIRDLAGRTVAQAARGYQGAGDHVWTWNGRDSGGRDLPTGVYLITVQSGLQQLTQKAALVR